MPHILKYCLQMNSIACANERIPRRARKSAFLGIVHFAHCQSFLNCQNTTFKHAAFSHRYNKKEFTKKYTRGGVPLHELPFTLIYVIFCFLTDITIAN